MHIKYRTLYDFSSGLDKRFWDKQIFVVRRTNNPPLREVRVE